MVTKVSSVVVALVVGSSAVALAQNRTSPVQPLQAPAPLQSSQLRQQPGAPNTVPGTAPGQEMLQSPELRLQPGAPNTVPGAAPGEEIPENGSMTGEPGASGFGPGQPNGLGFAPGQPSGLGFAPGQQLQQQDEAPSQSGVSGFTPGATE